MIVGMAGVLDSLDLDISIKNLMCLLRMLQRLFLAMEIMVPLERYSTVSGIPLPDLVKWMDNPRKIKDYSKDKDVER